MKNTSIQARLLAQANEELDNFNGGESHFDGGEEGFDEEGFDEEGFDEESFDDEYDGEDGYEYEYDGEDGFTQSTSKTVVINPNDSALSFRIRNTTATIQTAKIGGGYFGFVLPAGVIIDAPKAPEKSYAFMLEMLKSQPASIYAARMKFTAPNGPYNPINILNKSGYGSGRDSTIVPMDSVNGTYTNQALIDMPFVAVVGGADYLEMTLEPGEDLLMHLYIKSRVDITNTLRNKSAVERSAMSVKRSGGKVARKRTLFSKRKKKPTAKR